MALAELKANPELGPIQQIQAYFDTVISQKNIGEHLATVFADRDKMCKAIDDVVTSRMGVPYSKPHMTTVPNTSLEEFWLGLESFDYSVDGKNGFYPSNQQFQAHFGEFLQHGYRSGMGSVETKFDHGFGTREIAPFSVKFVDGQAKVLIMLSIVAYCVELEFGEQELKDPMLAKVLNSFRSIKCSFEFYENAAHHFLHSLKTGYVTAEKLTPSPITICADIKQAIALERRNGGAKLPLKDVLAKVIAQYNRMVTIKRHRIESGRRALIYNLLRGPADLMALLHKHYDDFRHESSGVPHEVLSLDFWVPGVSSRAELERFRGKKLFQTILATTELTCMTYFARATVDFAKKVAKEATTKAKKLCQLTEEQHAALHDISCLWLWLRKQMETEFPGDVISRHDELFANGHLDNDLHAIMKSGEEFQWDRVPFVLEATGKTMDSYMSEHQDRSRNALQKAAEASFLAWCEELKADQAQFLSEKILVEKEGQKARTKLVHQLEECHTRSWQIVSDFLKQNLTLFVGKTSDGESTILPQSRAWLKDMSIEVGNSQDDHQIVLLLNCPSIGVLSAARLSFILTYISNILSDFPLNSVCFLIHPNRAGHQDGRRSAAKKEGSDDEECEKKVKVKEGDDDSDSDCDGQRKVKEEMDDMVRKVRFNLETELALPERCLKVKNLTFVFDPATVYGKREGFLPGLCILSNNPKNIFRQTKGYKTGVVHGIHMLQRQDMVKPETASPQKSTSLPHMGRAFTDVQEQKQAAGGCDIVLKTLQAFEVPSVKATLMVDMHGYDGWPALATVEEICAKKVSLCASLCLDHSGQDLLSRVSNKVYEACRAGTLALTGFPDFSPLVSALKASSTTGDMTKNFRVTTQRHTTLVILEVLARKWVDNAETRERALAVIESHNKEFNESGQYWLEERRETADDAVPEPPMKKIKLESLSEQDISKLPNVKKLTINNACDLVVAGEKGDNLFLSSRSRNQFFEKRELCSFGSGEWRDGAEASECLSDAEGRWMSFVVNNNSLFILERKGISDHLSKLENLDTAVTLQSLVCDLQDAGEVKVEISHHKKQDDDWASVKPLVFVLDEVPEVPKKSRKRGKTAGSTTTSKNFGAFLSLTKIKSSESTLCVAWRCRLDSSSSTNGTKVITPIRPCLCLNTPVDMSEDCIRLM